MRKRIIILVTSGAVLLGVAALVLSVVVSRARPEFPAPHSYSWPGVPEQKGPRVQIGYDGPSYRVANAIRIDVRRGVPYTREEEDPIRDVARYVTEQLDRKGSQWVVVSASNEEKLGDVLKVIDACRTTRVHGIVVNTIPAP